MTVNTKRVLEQLRERGLDPNSDRPPNELKLRVFVDALGLVGLDLDSTFADLEVMLRAVFDVPDEYPPDDDFDEPTI